MSPSCLGLNVLKRRYNRHAFLQGLRITVNIDEQNYVGMFSHRVGAMVAIHPSDVTAFPQDTGISAAPGVDTTIGVRRVGVWYECYAF